MKKHGLSTLGLVLAIGLVIVFAISKVLLEKNARARLGGDVEVSRAENPAPLPIIAYLSVNGKFRSQILTTTAEAKANKADTDTNDEPKSIPVTLKVIDKPYPLYDKLDLTDIKRKRVFGSFVRGKIHGAAISQSLLDKLGIETGEHFFIGDKMFVASAIIANEPDRPADAGEDRVIIGDKAFGVMAKGNPNFSSPVVYSYRVKLAKNANLDNWRARFEELFPESTWKVRDWRDNTPILVSGIKLPFVLITLLVLVTILIVRITKNLPNE